MKTQTTRSKPAFNVNYFYEKISALKKTDPRAFDGLSPATKSALLEYEAQKREHADLSADQPDKAA